MMMVTVAQVQEMMGQADKDGTNSLDIIEFLQESSFSHYHDSIFMVIIIRCLIAVIVILTNYQSTFAADERKTQRAGEGGRDCRCIFCLRCGQKNHYFRLSRTCSDDDHDFVVIQDGNGYIDRRELALMMRFIGEPVTQEEIDVSCYHYY